MIYNFLYFSIGLFSIASLYLKRRQRFYPVIVFGALIILFQSLRWRTGTDWDPYLNLFKNVNTANLGHEFETGFWLLNSCIRYFTDNYSIFLFAECSLNMLFILIFLKSMSLSNPLLGLLYFFSLSVFPIRFTLATSIILLSYKFILKSKFWWFVFCVISAFLIHRTAIVFFPVYFFVRKKISIKILLVIYIGAIILGLAAEFTFKSIITLAVSFYGNASEVLQSKMNRYLDGSVAEYATMTPLRFILSIINSSIFIFIFYWFKQKYFKENTYYNVVFNLYVLGISLNRIFFQLIPDLARITSYFCGGFVVMVIMIISLYSRKRQVLYTFLFVCYLYINYYNTIWGYFEKLYIPYYSILSYGERPVVF